MARRGHAYPQIDPGAAGVIDGGVAAVSARATVRAALQIARRRDVVAVQTPTGLVLREDLARASGLGLDDLRADELWRPIPVVDGRASEVAVRRLLASGAPAVAVRDRRRVIGLSLRRGGTVEGPPLAAQLASALSAESRRALEAVGAITPASWLVGGVVRDVLRGATIGHDLDVVVEGDGPGVARALAARLRARVREHPRFLTASVETSDGRVDVATARAERYEAPGALPRVIPAAIGEDLGRRDFSINAMAIVLGSAEFALLDPLGGRRDLAARRLRVLHPLSFVEDPTRMFRAARYAARLRLSMEKWTAAGQALAVRLAPYPALSGARLVAELGLIVAEPRPDLALHRLGAAGVFRILDAGHRFTGRTATWFDELPRALAWGRERGLAVSGVELTVLAVLADQPPTVQRAALRRLGFTGASLTRLTVAAERSDLLRGAETPSARAARLRTLGATELAWLWLRHPERRETLGWWAGEGRHVRPALGGADVMALGVPQGPAIARVLTELLEARLDGRLRERDDEIAHVRAATTRREG
jgi:tRNA nucleotidyltransferase (CCA-adding enzyme)